MFDVDRAGGKLTLSELMPGATVEEVRAKTGAEFTVKEGIQEVSI